SATLKKTITDLLTSPSCSKGRRAFLIRLRDDPERRIEDIWKKLIGNGITVDLRVFVAGLAACWQFAELSDELAQLRRDCRKWQRDIDREVKEHKKNAFALIRGLSPRTKAEMLERTNAVLQRRWRAPDPVDLFLEEHGSDLQQMLQLFDIRSDH